MMQDFKKTKLTDKCIPYPHHPISIFKFFSAYHHQNRSLKVLPNHAWLSGWHIIAHCFFPNPCDLTSSTLAGWVAQVCTVPRNSGVWSGNSFISLLTWMTSLGVEAESAERQLEATDTGIFCSWVIFLWQVNWSPEPLQALEPWTLLREIWKCPLSLMCWQVCDKHGNYTQN